MTRLCITVLLTSYSFLLLAQEVSPRYELVKMDKTVNTFRHEAAPIVSPDGNSLYFFVQNHPDNTFGKDDTHAPARARGAGQSSCQPAAGVALLLGESMVGWRVWDVMRTIDYLQERGEVDPARIATMGISGGGTVSLFSGAVDERVKATVVSCYFNTFRDSIVSLSHCMDNYVPGLLREMEMYDVAGLVAPRALFVESGTEDRIFPLEGARAAYEQTVPIFQAFGASERLGREIFEGGHEFHGVGAFQFLSRHL